MPQTLPFWSSEKFESAKGIALATSGIRLSYSDLNQMVNDYAVFLRDLDLKNQLAFLPMEMNISSVVRYLACLRTSIVPLLLPSGIEESLMQNLKEVYKPTLMFGSNGLKDIHVNSNASSTGGLPEYLAVLLSTSGSTDRKSVV